MTPEQKKQLKKIAEYEKQMLADIASPAPECWICIVMIICFVFLFLFFGIDWVCHEHEMSRPSSLCKIQKHTLGVLPALQELLTNSDHHGCITLDHRNLS